MAADRTAADRPAGAGEPEAAPWDGRGRSPVDAAAFLADLADVGARRADDERVAQAGLRVAGLERDLDLALDAFTGARRRADEVAVELAVVREQEQRLAAEVAATARERDEALAAARSAREQLARVTGSRTWQARERVAGLVRRGRA